MGNDRNRDRVSGRIAWYVTALAFILLPAGAQAHGPPVPDPFCAPKDFYVYLSKQDHTRVRYAVERCPNIDLSEEGPGGQSFVQTLFQVGKAWDDIFQLIKTRNDLAFQQHLVALVNPRVPRHWFDSLFRRSDIQITDQVITAILFQDLIEGLKAGVAIGKIDPNRMIENTALILAAVQRGAAEIVEFLRTVSQINLSVRTQGVWSEICEKGVTSRWIKTVDSLSLNPHVNINSSCGRHSHMLLSIIENKHGTLFDRFLADPRFIIRGSSLKAILRLLDGSIHDREVEGRLQKLSSHPSFDVNEKDDHGNNAFHLYVMARAMGRTVSSLLKADPVLVNTENTNGELPLEWGIHPYSIPPRWGGELEALNTLLRVSGINPSQVTSKNSSPLLHALIHGKYQAAERLLAVGANPSKMGDVKPHSAKLLEGIAPAGSYRINLPILKALSANPDIDFALESPDGHSVSHRLIEKLDGGDRSKAGEGLATLIRNKNITLQHLDRELEWTDCPALINIAKHDGQVELLREVLNILPIDRHGETCKTGSRHNAVFVTVTHSAPANLEFLLRHTEIPWRIDLSESAYRLAIRFALGKNQSVERHAYATAKVFVRVGITDEINEPVNGYNLLNLARAAGEIADIEMLFKVPNLDPNAGAKHILLFLMEAGKITVIDSLLADPRFDIRRFMRQFRINRNVSKEAAYKKVMDFTLPRWSLQDSSDQTAASQLAYEVLAYLSNFDYFKMVASLPNFSPNGRLDLPRHSMDRLEGYPTNLLGFCAYDGHEKCFELLMQIPIANSAGFLHPVIAAADRWHGSDYFKKIAKLYYALPLAETGVPTLPGKTLEETLKQSRQLGNITFLETLLAEPKIKFSKADLQTIFQLRKLNAEIHRGDENSLRQYILFLDRLFQHPLAQPVKPWSTAVFDFDFLNHPDGLAWLKRWGPQLDLSVKDPDTGKTVVDRAAELGNLRLLETLVELPTTPLPRLLEILGRNYIYTNEIMRLILAQRKKDLPPNALQLYFARRINSENFSTEELDNLNEILKLIPSFARFTRQHLAEFTSTSPIKWSLQLARASQPAVADFHSRLLREDATFTEAKNLPEALIEAIKISHVGVADRLLRSGLNVKSLLPLSVRRDRVVQSTPMTIAARFKQLSMLIWLQKKGATPNDRPDCKGQECDLSPFTWAVRSEWKDGLDLLVKWGADINYTGQPWSNLAIACKDGSFSLYQWLIAKGANPDQSDALAAAAHWQRVDVFNDLIKRPGLDPNIPLVEPVHAAADPALKTRTTFAIIEAARFGQLNMVKALLAHPKIKKDVVDSSGYRAIDWAATHAHYDIVDLLKK